MHGNLVNRSAEVFKVIVPAGSDTSDPIPVGRCGYGSVEIYTDVGAGWSPTTVTPLVCNDSRYGVCPDKAGLQIGPITLLAGASNSLRATLALEVFTYQSCKLQFNVATTDDQTIYVALNA